mmetsp:Transcript_29199/g.41092  ORF Transcript_29199/g.41092 Transcript_29199/m.41092 type:complete len:494 (-) Transcript_29199:1288-2769(-)
MGSNSQQYLTAQKLEEALHKIYGNQQVRVKGDLYKVLGSSGTLRAKQDTFVSNTGVSQDLLVLDGTIPIQYQGAIYHIPVHIWITKSYPANSPLCFVMPTKDMIVKPQHKFVNSNGEVFIPYLKEWRSDVCDLFGLTIALSHAFSYEPPLFARPPPAPQPKPQPSPAQSPVQNPASNGSSYPSPQPSNGIYPSVNATPISQPPPQYPYPTHYVTNGYPNPYVDVSPSPQYSYVNTMPYNPQPNAVQPQPIPMQQPKPSPQQVSNQPSPVQPHNSPIPVHPQQTVTPVMPNQIAPSSDINNGPSHPYNVDLMDSHPYVQSPLPQKKTIEPKMVLNAKLQERLAKFNDEMTDQIDFYVTNEQALTDNERKIQHWYSQMQQYKNELEQYEALLEANDMQATEFLNANEMVEVDVDTIVGTTDPLTNQVLELVSEDSAIEDTLYYLNRALESNSIDLDTFLKSFRALSKQQFYARSTAKKAAASHPNLQGLFQQLHM